MFRTSNVFDSKNKYIHAREESQHKIISTLIEKKGQFDVPAEQRSRVHRTAYVKYWRLRESLSFDAKGHILFQGKRVVKKTEIDKVVTKTFKKNKSGGYKKLRTRAVDGYTGVSNNKILSITSNDERFKKFTA